VVGLGNVDTLDDLACDMGLTERSTYVLVKKEVLSKYPMTNTHQLKKKKKEALRKCVVFMNHVTYVMQSCHTSKKRLYGMAMISRLLEIIGLFCKRAL